jgi:hypothetical protein
MTPISHSRCIRLAFGAVLIAALAPTASAQVPANCPHVCNQTYALCIAASCDATGSCGACSASDGSCGYCYVFTGQSCSYQQPCSAVAPSGKTVYSTYSEILAQDFGFQAMTCPAGTYSATADCMDQPCTLTGSTVTLTNKSGQSQQVPTAICQCELNKPGGGATLGGQCNTGNCSAIWSTANPQLFQGATCPASKPAPAS